MQLPRRFDRIPCGTVRIEADELSSVYAADATLTTAEEEGAAMLSAHGELQDLRRKARGAAYSLSYRFTEDGLTLTALSACTGTLRLPVVCGKQTRLSVAGRKAILTNEKATVRLQADKAFLWNPQAEWFFNPICGFLYADLALPLAAGEPVTVKIS